MQKNTEFYTPLNLALKDIKSDPKITKKKIELNIFSVSSKFYFMPIKNVKIRVMISGPNKSQSLISYILAPQ